MKNLESLEDIEKIFKEMTIEAIKNHEIKENMSHKEFIEEITILNESLKENPLEKIIPYVKKGKRKELVEKYNQILIDFVNLTYEIGKYSLSDKDAKNLSIEEQKKICIDYIDSL